jgi:hypothetical protein
VILASGASITVAHGGNLTLASKYGINSNDNTAVYVVNNGDFYCVPTSVDNFVTQISVPFQNYGMITCKYNTSLILIIFLYIYFCCCCFVLEFGYKRKLLCSEWAGVI